MPQQRYLIPAGFQRSETEAKRSRFITSLQAATGADEALEFISRIKQEFPDANHNCWAYLIGPPGSSDRLGLSDDGEPHGAAGKPMLTVIQHSEIGDIVIVVTRYFGGVKLGKGGMVKAYTHAVQNALDQLVTEEKVDWLEITVSLDYSCLATTERILPEHEAAVTDKSFAEQITLELKLPAERWPGLKRALLDLTAGKVRIAHDSMPKSP